VSQQPVAFMSYVRFDDQHERGRLTEFCQSLSGEVRLKTGSEFRIFQDRNDIALGQQWQERINESLDAVTFLVPILTPLGLRGNWLREQIEGAGSGTYGWLGALKIASNSLRA
jgi:cobaltochelatase CobT